MTCQIPNQGCKRDAKFLLDTQLKVVSICATHKNTFERKVKTFRDSNLLGQYYELNYAIMPIS